MPASLGPYLICMGVGVLNILVAVRVLCRLIADETDQNEFLVPLLLNDTNSGQGEECTSNEDSCECADSEV